MRRVVDVVIVNDTKLLMVQEKKPSAYGLWDFPGGGIEGEETIEQAAFREIAEELGVTLTEQRYFKTYPYTDKKGDMFELNVVLGQIEGNIKLRADEILAYEWMSLTDIKQLSRDGKLRGNIIYNQAKDALLEQAL